MVLTVRPGFFTCPHLTTLLPPPSRRASSVMGIQRTTLFMASLTGATPKNSINWSPDQCVASISPADTTPTVGNKSSLIFEARQGLSAILQQRSIEIRVLVIIFLLSAPQWLSPPLLAGFLFREGGILWWVLDQRDWGLGEN